ncbi:MAG: OprO/OprP family phosphate-selective porin [Elusimicrobiales bacterium]|nr:OprO/OprP family phosphate-selective porin [Elusimicrobiales bacterium]
MRKNIFCIKSSAFLALAFLLPVLNIPEAAAQAGRKTNNHDMESIYKRIEQLEREIGKIRQKEPEQSAKQSLGLSAFNPYISIVLNGKYSYYSNEESGIAGFQTGEEGELPEKGFSLGESEINMGANIDDKFLGNLTVAIVNEDGEDKIELEEAFLQTIGLPCGISLTAGRMKPVFGYLNEKHSHTDDFSDRPLPYRVYLNGGYKDDGAQFAFVLPFSFYVETGGGLYNGTHFPASAEADRGNGASTAYLRFGGDIGTSNSWLAGASWLHSKNNAARETDGIEFTGKSDLYGFFLKHTYSPGGNSRHSEFSVQGEYLIRNEKGFYDIEGGGPNKFDNKSSGWYAQAVYKFLPRWKAGYRYSRMKPEKVPAALADTPLDAKDHRPEIHTAMIQWDNSEFSRIRFQYSHDRADFERDDRFTVEYTVTFGAHGAHSF